LIGKKEESKIMPNQIRAIINPELLIWARKTAGLSIEISAKKAQIKEQYLVSWEKGQSYPSIPQLIKLSKIYKRPISVFYLPEPPKLFASLRDYRRLPNQPPPILSPQLLYEIRRANERRDIALELYELLGEKPPMIKAKINLTDNPEVLSSMIRKLLAIDIEIQLRWKNVFEAYTEWRKALDSIGIMSFQTSDSKIKLDEMRGFSNSQMPLPITVINKNDFPAARIFSLMHELAHILLRKEGICEFENVDVLAEEEREIEKFCNHVAGAVLVPEYHLLSQPIIGKLSKKNMVDDLEILNLSRLYKASREVVLRRLLHFGLISSDYYSDKKEIYDKEAKKKATEEAHRAAKGGNRFIVPIYLKNMYSNGRGYTDLILKSYYQEKITLSDVSGYLGIKLKHLPKIEAAMSRFISYA